MLQPVALTINHIQFSSLYFLSFFTEIIVNSKMPLVQVSPGTDLIKVALSCCHNVVKPILTQCYIVQYLPLSECYAFRSTCRAMTSNFTLCQHKLIISGLLNKVKIIP